MERQPPPRIEKVSAKLATLERRRAFLEEKLQGSSGSERSLRFTRDEAAALRAAEVALTFHRNVIERMDEPLGCLRELIEAYDGPADAEGRMRAAVGRARLVLEEFETLARGLSDADFEAMQRSRTA